MSSHLSARVPDELVELLDDAADEYDLSRSELVRELLWQSVSEGEVFDSLPLESKRSIWQKEAKPKQHRAWFRSNVKDRLYKCFNSDLTVQEMKLDMHGRIQEAEEYDRTEWLEGAFAAYEQAVESGSFGDLQRYFTRDNPGGEAAETGDDGSDERVTHAETWVCTECGAGYQVAPNSVSTKDVRMKPRECKSCGNDRFRPEGMTRNERSEAEE